jgi:hypothetical protein
MSIRTFISYFYGSVTETIVFLNLGCNRNINVALHKIVDDCFSAWDIVFNIVRRYKVYMKKHLT